MSKESIEIDSDILDSEINLKKTDSIGEIEWTQSVSGGKVHAVDEFSNGDLMFFSTDFGSTNLPLM